MFIDESFDIRLPSINRAIYNNPGELRRFSGNVWAILESRFKFLPRFDCPVVVIITAFYPDERYVIDADNIFVKPVIDCLAKHCFHGGHDGFKEMREVRKRSRLGKSGFRVEVYAEEDMPC